MVKVSVIMPVYNGSAYLKKCMDSVINQTLKEIEIICVDDGSTDDSYQMLKDYQKKDDRIQLLKQQNKYAGAARNLGKKHATGEYVIFWDCDDYFELDALEILYKRAKEMDADICVCGAYRFYTGMEGSAPYTLYMDKKYTKGMDVFNLDTNRDYILNFTNDAPWNKLYRRKFVEESNLDFQEIRNGNDVFFTVNAMCMAKRVTTVDKRLIHYRKNIGEGLVATLSKASLAPCYAWTSAADSLIANGVFPERSFANKAVGAMLYLLRNIDSREAFMQTMTYLQKEGVEKLHLRVREPGYYYSEWYEQVVYHLNHDTPEEFQTFLAYQTYIQNVKQEAVLRTQKNKLEQVVKELAWLKKLKIYKVLLKMRNLYRKLKNK